MKQPNNHTRIEEWKDNPEGARISAEIEKHRADTLVAKAVWITVATFGVLAALFAWYMGWS